MGVRANILIVDDIEENIQVLGNMIRNENYNVYASLDGEKALEVLSNKSIDLILLDILMPGMNGYEVCERIKSNEATRDIPVIFLTARTETEDIVKGLKLGAVDYVTKPFRSEELLQRIKTHLKMSEQQQQIEEQIEKLNGQNKKLNELNATKDKFFSIIAHDLKNPFSTIMGFSQFLVNTFEQNPPEKNREMLKKVYDSSDQAYKLLENLLNWSRLQTGRFEYLPQTIDLSQVTSEAISLQQEIAAKKNIRLINELPAETYVKADRNSIATVIRNLISNALKFTPEKGKVVIKPGTQYDGKFTVTVQDTGVGIKKEVKENLFRLDRNVSRQGTNNEQGTGLGLILVKEFVEQNGGSIWVESEPGMGSEISFTLPVAEAELSVNQSSKQFTEEEIAELKNQLKRQPDDFQKLLQEDLIPLYQNAARSFSQSSIQTFITDLDKIAGQAELDKLQTLAACMQDHLKHFNVKGLKRCFGIVADVFQIEN